MGLVDAAILSSHILTKYSPKLLVMTGVCGGRATKKVKVGDIIIPEKIIDYQTGKYEKGKYKSYGYDAEIDDDLISHAREWRNHVLRAVEDAAESSTARIKKTEVHFDVMASGSLVLKTDGSLDYIADSQNDKTVAVEMESYSIARVCNMSPFKNHTKAIVIKASMDGAGQEKNDDAKEWAAQISAKFAHHFIKRLESEGYFK